MEKSEIILTGEEKRQLGNLINQYYELNSQQKSLKDASEAIKCMLKQKYEEYGLSTYTNEDGVKVNVSETTKPVFDEDGLVAYFKKCNNVPGIIKTKEYVDMDVFENAIYNKIVEVKDVAKYMTEKTTVRLTCTKKEQLNE